MDEDISTLQPAIKGKILHFGLGAFHRAHQADYTHDANSIGGQNWSIEAVAMRNPELAQVVNENNIFHLLIQAPGGIEFKPISPIKSAVCLADNPALVSKKFEDPDLQIITITVTEKGYGLDRKTGRLNLDDPIIRDDLKTPNSPKGLVGALTEGLRRRKAVGGKGITLASCDNLPANGKLLKQLVLEYAKILDKDLANWIEAKCSFPSSMVDRITPASTEKTMELVKEQFGIIDKLAVETEPFRQWVIEDDFAGPRPAWEKAGAILVENVGPFELMKLRMLNGAHSFIAYLGTYLDFSAVRDVMADSQIAEIVDQHMIAAGETLPSIEGFDLADYRHALIERFKNPAIDHRCIQIAMDGSQKMPQRIFAPAASRLENGQSIKSFALATALWMKHIGGKSVFGTQLDLNDPLADKLRIAVGKYPTDAHHQITALGKIAELETHDLFSNDIWTETLGDALKMLEKGAPFPNASKTELIASMKNWLAA